MIQGFLVCSTWRCNASLPEDLVAYPIHIIISRHSRDYCEHRMAVPSQIDEAQLYIVTTVVTYTTTVATCVGDVVVVVLAYAATDTAPSTLR